MFRKFFQEIDSIIERDPAAGSRLGIIFLYPSFNVIVLTNIYPGISISLGIVFHSFKINFLFDNAQGSI